MNNVASSANGTASQTPVIPIMAGSNSILITINIKVLQNEIIADVFPSENAVNMADPNTLIPANI